MSESYTLSYCHQKWNWEWIFLGSFFFIWLFLPNKMCSELEFDLQMDCLSVIQWTPRRIFFRIRENWRNSTCQCRVFPWDIQKSPFLANIGPINRNFGLVFKLLIGVWIKKSIRGFAEIRPDRQISPKNPGNIDFQAKISPKIAQIANFSCLSPWTFEYRQISPLFLLCSQIDLLIAK